MMSQTATKNFLPDFCELKMLLAVFFLTELLAFLLTLAANGTAFSFLSDFTLRSFLAIWIAFISVALLCQLRPSVQHLSDGVVGLLAFIIIQLVSFLICWLIIEILPQWLLLERLSVAEKIVFYGRTLGISALVSMAFLRYLYVLFQWQQQIEAKATFKLNALQARMRPHFLFNSLNSIASLTRINPPLAETLVEDLAELIRASMNLDEALLVRLEQEIKLVELYLAIETQRLDERLKVRWMIDELPQDALIPPLSLQPLVENAVYYGIEPNPLGGEIVISGIMQANHLLITVTNPQATQPQLRPGNHIALENLSARLAGCFQNQAWLRVESDEKTYQVLLEIPYRT